MAIQFFKVDYNNAQQSADLVRLVDAYARDPMGGGVGLGTFARDSLARALSEFPGAFSVLGYVDKEAVAMANCLRSFSTFACRPLINIHDFYVAPAHREQGHSQRLMAFIESIARQERCCKLTLEVLENNKAGLAAHQKAGFSNYSLGGSGGQGIFLQKPLS